MGARWFKVRIKTAEPVVGKTLTRELWSVIAPEVTVVLKTHGCNYTSLKMVRFSTIEGDEKVFDPMVA